MNDELVFDQEFHEYLFKIRQSMQIVQAQFDVMNNAVEKCSSVERRPETMHSGSNCRP
ncbi:MAG TPA: hypothetical protein VMC84_07230 [Methanocella sp.]|uniref:hypothetical protein n=1 Tax=Methanocella sp. TaxID=2052833 RepID=UPI002C659540|nr:hypothetical protein [Methanocella sp.]HTY90956.1 hypothetical protein [Methanocella sp.]